MPRFILAFLILSVLMFTGFAQSKKKPGIDERIDKLNKELSLTPEQSAQLRPILEYEQKEMESVRELNKEDRRAVNDARKNLREQTDRQILGLLTDEQKESYKKLQAEKPQNPRLRELQKQLDLSPAQVQQLGPIMDKYQKEMEQLREDSDGDRKKMRKEMRSIREKEHKEISALLTDEQKDAYDEMLKEQKEQRGERGGKRGGGRRGGGSRF